MLHTATDRILERTAMPMPARLAPVGTERILLQVAWLEMWVRVPFLAARLEAMLAHAEAGRLWTRLEPTPNRMAVLVLGQECTPTGVAAA